MSSNENIDENKNTSSQAEENTSETQVQENDTVKNELPVEEGTVPEEGTPEFYELALQKAREEASKNHDHYLRALSDLENFRRRTIREKEEIRKYALGNFFEDFLPVIDNFYYGMDAASKHTETKGVLDGFTMVFEQLKSLMAQHGLEEVYPEGKEFDPNFHDCFSHQPSETIGEGKVLQVIRRGYTLNGRLLRPASVIVSSGVVTAGDKEQTEELES